MTAASIAAALDGHRSGSGYVACCPAHDDKNPSLSIAEKSGKLLFKCHAGCPQSDVIAALRERGLWTEQQTREHPQDWGRIVATYDYVDESGTLLYQVCRFEPKTFRPRRPDGSGGWKWGYGSVRRVLYRLREVLEAPILFVVEGEKDAEALRKWGFVATTNAGGANAHWLSGFTEALAGREVILIPDADPIGREHMRIVARALLGRAAKIIWIELQGAKDISEWFEQGHSECELVAMLEGCHAV